MTAGGTASGFSALDPCVHCGFCLPACPTYLATGDEADSPRGRILLMRALERGEVAPGDAALLQHLDACLGCRGCEPVCPSGVGYGRGLEAARELLAQARGFPPKAALLLGVFRSQPLWRAVFGAGRVLRDSGVARRFSGRSRVGFAMAMLASTRAGCSSGPKKSRGRGERGTVALFRGCVMDVLFSHVHQATARTLEANGYRVIEVPNQECCGALHAHAGDRPSAVALARRNVEAFEGTADHIVVNSAGCGALLKDYGHLVESPQASVFSSRVKDISELLAAAGPRPGAALEADVAYDAPCHLQHAQRVQEPVLAMLRAIQGLPLRILPGSDKCCGSAGIYSMLEPEMSREVLGAKIAAIVEARPRPTIVATGNPGCLMQIGAGLLSEGLLIEARHPVELLDWSYEKAGYYRENGA